MARYLYNGTDLDLCQNVTAITGNAVSVSASGIFSTAFTAPNTTNKVTGCFIFFSSLPTAGNGDIVITLQESTVDKVSATMLVADVKLGFNYVRFSTPYQFTTTSASAYRFKANSTVTTNGTIRTDGSLFMYGVTIDNTMAVSSISVGNDIWCMGFHDSGLTTKSLSFSGTSLSFGTGTDTSMGSQTTATVGAALTIGNGGTVAWDTAASCTVQIRGSIFATNGGTLDKRGNSSDITKVSKLIIDNNTSNNQFGVLSAFQGYGGKILTTGKTVNAYAIYSSGTGTSASPVVTTGDHGFTVDDELIFGGASDYAKNEIRYVKSIPATNQLVLSSTIGGAESALAQTHAASSYIGNMTRNSIITPLTTTRGYWVINSTNVTSFTSSFDYTRMEYSSCQQGFGFQLNTTSGLATMDGLVMYHNSVNGRNSVTVSGSVEATYSNIIMYNQTGTIFAGQSGLVLSGSSNKTINYILGYNAPGGTGSTGILSLFNGAVNNTINHLHTYGANSVNNSAGYALGIVSSIGNTFNNCTIDATRQQGIYYSSVQDNTFNNCNFGAIATNTIELLVASGTYNTSVFNSCTTASATTVSGASGMLSGSKIGFHRFQDTDRTHRSYRPFGNFQSTGSSLTDTVADTTFDADSLAFRLEPISATDYLTYTWGMPQRAGNTIVYSGKIRKTSAFNGNAKVELFLDGSSTADATYTLSGSADTWIPFVLSADYTSGTIDRNASIKVSVRGTAGYVYMDTFFNSAKQTNPIGSLDLWQDGAPNSYLVSTVASASEIAGIVWDTAKADHTIAGTFGKSTQDIESNTDATQAKVDQL